MPSRPPLRLQLLAAKFGRERAFAIMRQVFGINLAAGAKPQKPSRERAALGS